MRRSSSHLVKPQTVDDLRKVPFTRALQRRSNLSHQYSGATNPPKQCKKPRISSQSWIVAYSNGQVIESYNANEIREIASLSKIMTCIVVIEEILRTRRSFHELIHVSEPSTNIIGTKANLTPNDCLKIWDLLHALMLPSGNDAALTLAEHIGKTLDPTNPLSSFVQKMNSLAKSLKMDSTSFSNPHGLSNTTNLSSAKNLSVLVNYALSNTVFRKIVAKKEYACSILGVGGYRKVTWENTNRLLNKGFCGVKTGFTPNAGPCLACSLERGGRRVVLILLSAKTMNSRWTEAGKLIKWLISEGKIL